MILASTLFGFVKSSTAHVPQSIIDNVQNHNCDTNPHLQIEEEGVYQYCEYGLMYKMLFTPENKNDCEVQLYGEDDHVYTVIKYCKDGADYFYDVFSDKAVQNFFSHFGITVSEESRRKRH